MSLHRGVMTGDTATGRTRGTVMIDWNRGRDARTARTNIPGGWLERRRWRLVTAAGTVLLIMTATVRRYSRMCLLWWWLTGSASLGLGRCHGRRNGRGWSRRCRRRSVSLLIRRCTVQTLQALIDTSTCRRTTCRWSRRRSSGRRRSRVVDCHFVVRLARRRIIAEQHGFHVARHDLSG